MYPVSRWFFKCWRDDYMAQTIDYLQNELNYCVALTCAPDTREKQSSLIIINQCQTLALNLGGQLTLKQTGALSTLAAVFLE